MSQCNSNERCFSGAVERGVREHDGARTPGAAAPAWSNPLVRLVVLSGWASGTRKQNFRSGDVRLFVGETRGRVQTPYELISRNLDAMCAWNEFRRA
jgi:hypothetical protein